MLLAGSDYGIPSLELVAIRAGFQLVIVAGGILTLRTGFVAPYGTRLFVGLRGIIGGAGFLCYFHAMTVLELGDAVTLLSLYPVFSVFAGWCVCDGFETHHHLPDR